MFGDSEDKAAKAGRRAGRLHFGDTEDAAAASSPSSAAAVPPLRSTGSRKDALLATSTSQFEQPAPSPRSGPRKVGFDASAVEKSERDEMAPNTRDGDKKFVGMSRRKQQQLEISESTKGRSKYDEREQATELMEIPELQEEGKEDLTRMVAAAPRMRAAKVAQLEELQDEVPLALHVAGGEGRDIDLSLLTSFLCAYDQVQEEDDIWDPEQLLADVASAIHADREQGRGRTESRSSLVV